PGNQTVTILHSANGLTSTFAGLPDGAGITFGGNTYAVRYTANDVTLTRIVAPVITSANSTTFEVGVAGSFNVTASGVPTVAVTAGPLPTGVTLSPSGVLSGTPAAGTAGDWTFTITATNAAGSDTQSFTLHAFGFTCASSTFFNVGSFKSFAVTTAG